MILELKIIAMCLILIFCVGILVALLTGLVGYINNKFGGK